MIFFEREQQDDKQDDAKGLRVGMLINNAEFESWFKQQVKELLETEHVKQYTGKEDLSDIQLLIILRKNKRGGVTGTEAVDCVKQYAEKNPEGRVLFIVGDMDQEGQEMVKAMQSHTKHLTLAYAEEGKALTSAMMVQKLQEVAEGLRQHEESSTSSKKSRIHSFRAVKGGCGVTTIVTQFANTLADAKVLIVEKKDSLQYFSLQDHVTCQQVDELTVEDFQELHEQYDYILLDELEPPNDFGAIQVLLIDGSQESVKKAAGIEADIVILNQSCPEVMPTEVVEAGIKRKIDIEIPYDRPAFIQASITGDQLVKDFDALLEKE